MSNTARKAAPRLAKPAVRYWKGKAPKGVAEVASDSESDDNQEPAYEEGDVAIAGVEEEYEDDGGALPVHSDALAHAKTMNVALKNVNISKEGKVIVAGREESGRTTMEDEVSEEDESEEDAKEPGQAAESDESSEEETDSEDEKPKVMFRPVFVPKRARVTVQEREAEAVDTEEAIKKRELEAEERRKQSHDLVAESIRRELAEKEKEENVPDVDDTDGLDPEAEFEAWRLRELGRIKRDKEEAVRRDEEREEVERRRALPEEQRMKEDLERAEKSRAEKPKGQQKFLQRYHHKGAFHQDAEILKRHDFTEATESTIDMTLLPQVMQKKNFGKRSQTKYTHLLDQDTTVQTGGFGSVASKPGGGQPGNANASGCFLCGGPHLKRDCPKNLPGPSAGTGANNAPTGQRQWGVSRDRPADVEKTWRNRDGALRTDDGRDRPRDGYRDERGTRATRSRSRSPRRRYEDLDRRPLEKNSDRRRSRDLSVENEGAGKKRRRFD